MAIYQVISAFQAKKGFARKSDTDAGKLGLELDATIEEDPDYGSTVTQNAVEKGADVSDHVAIKPLILRIQAIITNTPVNLIKIVKGATFTDPAGAGYRYLKKLHEEGQPFDFVGGYEIYKNLVITSLSAPRKAATANALVFNCTMQQINLVQTREVTLAKLSTKKADVKPKAAPSSDLGFQPAGTYQNVDPTAGTLNNSSALTKQAQTFFNAGGSYPMPAPIGGL